MISINPIEKDLVATLKTGALLAAGIVGATALAAFAESKSPTLGQNKWATPAIMIGGGVAIGMLLKGKNKPLATKVGLGGVAAGIFTLAAPYLVGKVPGIGAATHAITAPADTSGFAGYVAAGRGGRGLSGYTAAMIPRMSGLGLGAYDPFEYYDN